MTAELILLASQVSALQINYARLRLVNIALTLWGSLLRFLYNVLIWLWEGCQRLSVLVALLHWVFVSVIACSL